MVLAEGRRQGHLPRSRVAEPWSIDVRSISREVTQARGRKSLPARGVVLALGLHSEPRVSPESFCHFLQQETATSEVNDLLYRIGAPLPIVRGDAVIALETEVSTQVGEPAEVIPLKLSSKCTVNPNTGLLSIKSKQSVKVIGQTSGRTIKLGVTSKATGTRAVP